MSASAGFEFESLIQVWMTSVKPPSPESAQEHRCPRSYPALKKTEMLVLGMELMPRSFRPWSTSITPFKVQSYGNLRPAGYGTVEQPYSSTVVPCSRTGVYEVHTGLESDYLVSLMVR